MSRFLNIRNKFIYKESIAYIAYNDGKIEDCDLELYDIAIFTKYGDKINLSHLNNDSFTNDLNYIESNCNLCKITPGIIINLNVIYYLEFYKVNSDFINYEAIIKWDFNNINLPETFILSNDYSDDEIQDLIKDIKKRGISMIKMSESDLYSKMNEIEKNIAQQQYDTVELAKQVAIYNFIKYDLLGE